MKIITISREFGSGGRELGKRLAAALDIPCYDHKIIELIAKEHGFDEQYVANVSEKSIEAAYPMTIGCQFLVPPIQLMDQPIRVASAQRKIIENFAERSDCVIVGRAADAILEKQHPMNLFVYADLDARILRCQERAPEGEDLSQNEMARMIRQIDRQRSQYHQMYSDEKWGAKESYHLCVNTSGREIKTLIPGLVAYVRAWFGE